MKLVGLLLSGSFYVALATAWTTPAFAYDSRLETIAFDDAEVVPVYVQEGFAVQLSLSKNEHIEAAGTGIDSHCEDATALWCVVARTGDHDVYVNMHAGAVTTNLFVKTDQRNYSFDLIPLANGLSAHRRRTYRIQFRYPDEIAKRRDAALKVLDEKRDEKLLDDRLQSPPVVRNWNYTMQALPGGENIEPTQMYDDGLFTYLRFPNNREFPSIYMVSEDGSESVVQWHVDSDVMVVHRVARRFVLRDGAAVVGLWNEAYDPDGVAPVNGVTVPGVVRSVIPPQPPRRAPAASSDPASPNAAPQAQSQPQPPDLPLAVKPLRGLSGVAGVVQTNGTDKAE